MKFKIAVVQMDLKENYPKENLARVEKFIKKRHQKALRLLFFRKIFFRTVVSDRILVKPKHPHGVNFGPGKEILIDIVPGSFIEQGQDGLHDTTYYIDSTGKIRSRYRKIHLWYPDDKNFKPGHRVPVFKTKFGRIGLIICWDLIFPELFRRMSKRGVRVVICPSYWAYGDAGKIGKKLDKRSKTKLVDAMCVGRGF